MPDDWVKMVVKVEIPETHMSLFRKTSTVERPDPIMEVVSLGIKTKVKMGQDFKLINFSYKKFNIDSVGQSSIFNYLIETVFPGHLTKSNHNALDLELEMSPRLEKGAMRVRLETHAYWYIVANMPLVKEVQEFFGGET